MPSLFGLAPGGVCPAASVAGNAVRSYRTFSPLLAGGGRFVLCGTFPGVAPAGCYPAPHVDGARTFLFRHLSVLAGAAVRPTDASRHGDSGALRQGISLVNCKSRRAGTKARSVRRAISMTMQ